VLCIAGAACDGGGHHGGGGSTGEACPEIFALGFRNPWRMNFDPDDGRLFVGDVGQVAREEIDLVLLGGNYGWDCREGDVSHTTTANCSATFIDPEVAHDRTDARAITGGVVYRGTAIPELDGFYVYGDFLSQRFFAFDADAPNAPTNRITQLNAPVSAFGQGRDGEIYAVTFDSPSILKIVRPTGTGLAALAFSDAFPGRAFTNPVKLVQHPTNDDRWYVVEQGGLVLTFLSTNTTTPTVAANVDALVNLGSGGEQGLLGMAFDPGFASSGEVYFAYTDESAQAVTLARWVSSNNGLTFTQDAAPIVMSVSHGRDNHNASDIMFGPDGFLYYSMGDGGGADDPDNNGQNPNVLLGKILRIDVNSQPPAGKNYAIPAGNPNAANPQCN
jgi:glucose/arabinose dehydrogenase